MICKEGSRCDKEMRGKGRNRRREVNRSREWEGGDGRQE